MLKSFSRTRSSTMLHSSRPELNHRRALNRKWSGAKAIRQLCKCQPTNFHQPELRISFCDMNLSSRRLWRWLSNREPAPRASNGLAPERHRSGSEGYAVSRGKTVDHRSAFLLPRIGKFVQALIQRDAALTEFINVAIGPLNL